MSAALLLLFAWPGYAQEPPARLKIELANVRWQRMPPEVQEVFIGPDGRTWYQLNSDIPDWSLAEIKRRMEREWNENSPQISGVRLALLEPKGRAWFLTKFGRSLLGYDGRSWIEYQGNGKSPNMTGIALTQGGFVQRNYNPRFAGDRAWFSGNGGIHVFDGRDWQFQKFAEPGDVVTTTSQFAVSPSGKFAAVVYGEKLTLWTWRDGTWTKGRDLKNERVRSIEPFFVTDQGVMWHLNVEELVSISLPGATNVATVDEEEGQEDKEVAALIKQLGDDDFARREEASKKLAELGASIKSNLSEALKVATDVEIKLRLSKLLESPTFKAAWVAPVTKVAKYRVSEVKQLVQDDQGMLYIAAVSIRAAGDKSAPGLLMVDAAGKIINFLSNPAGLEPWWHKGGGSRPQFYLARENGLWLSPYPGLRPAAFFDFKEKKLTAELPDTYPARVAAIDKEGRVYASSNGPLPSGMVFTPSAPEVRLKLPETRFPIIPITRPFVALDGSIWAERKIEGLSRFDGKDWTAVDLGEKDTLTPVGSGEEGIVLYEGLRKLYGGKGKHYLLQRGTLLGKGNIRDLVKTHQAILAKAFATPRSSRYSPHQARDYRPEQCVVLAADKWGDIWLLEENNKLSVLVGEVWLDATELVKAFGSREGGVGAMAPFGDNSRIYLSIFPTEPRPTAWKSLIGEVQDGKLLFQDSQMMNWGSAPFGLREAGGALWVSGARSLQFDEQLTLRIGQNGQAQEIQDGGWPLLIDESGNAWLGKIRQQPQNKLVLWRSGKIMQRLEIPLVDRVTSLFSDKPGSVYAVTSLGLTHLIAEGDGPYRVDKTYLLPIIHQTWQPMHSRLGYVVTNLFSGYPPEAQVAMLKLPQE